MGTIDQIVEEVRARRDRWQMSYVVVDEAAVDDFAPVVSALTGS